MTIKYVLVCVSHTHNIMKWGWQQTSADPFSPTMSYFTHNVPESAHLSLTEPKLTVHIDVYLLIGRELLSTDSTTKLRLAIGQSHFTVLCVINNTYTHTHTKRY